MMDLAMAHVAAVSVLDRSWSLRESFGRDRLALALDLDDLVEALALASRLEEFFGVVKIGIELFSASGPEAIAAFRDRGFDVFVDLKLHDMNGTVHKAARVLGAVGAKYVTLHAQGGADMLRAGVEGLLAGAERAGLEQPIPLAVTVLPTAYDIPRHIVPERVVIAQASGCGGLVCSGEDTAVARALAPELLRVVPGIRVCGGKAAPAPGTVTASEAMAAGADLLVVGAAVTEARDPESVARVLLAQVAV